ncbi:MAG: cell division control protein Cdc6 [Hadesarchaea archaeon]|nr:MAG: cell division control protein Cdc6 [Hadesarchaea archaeon]
MRGELFKNLVERSPIFKNRELLRPSYLPERLPHREKQIEELARILSSPLRGETPSNVFIYGKTGTGKTATVRYVVGELERVGRELNREIRGIYLNCERVNTRYRILATLTNSLSEGNSVPTTGWPLDILYEHFLKTLDSKERAVIIVMDEVDRMVMRKGDEILYDLTRINSELERAKVSVIGISNDARFTHYLDPRVRSSLGEEELVFPPYDALQLRDILEERASEAFHPGVLGEGVIPLCAAHAAREHGDARRALDLLRVAGELAEREGMDSVTLDHVKKAYEKLEEDKVVELVRTLPTQSKVLLFSLLLLAQRGMEKVTTGEVYEAYRRVALQGGMDVLTPRRVGDLLSELDMLGIISTRIINSGRYGRTKEISLNLSVPQLKKILGEEERFLSTSLSLPHQTKLF